ncbi:hypothetical protein G7046_g6830 [Stylonectria norvegica]|nr:hypothetical protein G7046_g6830 [Stylonectria norvegica]
MKYSTVFALAMAPLSMASRFHSFNPVQALRRSPDKHDNKHNGNQESNDEVIVLDGKKNKNYGDSGNSKTEIIIIWANAGGGAATTTINEKVTVTQTVTAGAGATDAVTTPNAGATATAPIAGASHTVTVGGPGGLVFQPDQLNDVPMGDTVVFEFLAQNHTVTQSPFDTPCDALPNGMDSGFMANPNNTVVPAPQIAMQVLVSTPLWFYCKQAGHCGKGMVFSINPTKEKTQAMFQAAAIQQKGDGSSTPITGGKGESSVPVEMPAATSAPPTAASSASVPEGTASSGGDGATPGKGTVGSDGSCICVVACAAGSFPAVDSQGLGAFGGQAGSLATKMAPM